MQRFYTIVWFEQIKLPNLDAKEEYMEIIQFLGRFHPLVLHLPIGILAFTFILEWIDRKNQEPKYQTAIKAGLFWGMLTAVITALFGWFLHLEGGYSEDVLEWHKKLGIILTVFSVILYLIKGRNFAKKIYFPVFGITVLLLILAGHSGGSLTHGSTYLTDKLPQPVRSLFGMPPIQKKAAQLEDMTDIENAIVFDDLVMPILENKCNSCHNPDKKKGKLALHSIEAIETGGESGAVFVAGDPDNSLIIQNICAPMSDDTHMPPDGKRQLTEDEIEILKWWVKEHQGYDLKVKDYEMTERIDRIFQKEKKVINPLYALDISEPKESRVNSILNEGIRITKVAQNVPYLEVQLSNRNDITQSMLKTLKKLDDQIISLDLGNTNVDDNMLSHVSGLKHLVKLYLDKDSITDAGLKHLQGLEYLEYLNLYGTEVTDEGIQQLAGLKNLRKLYLWQTEVTEAGVKTLNEQIPALEADLGLDAAEMFSSASLRPPLIEAENEMFTDSIEVSFTLNLSDVNIYYTLDGSVPDSTSMVYNGPFYVNRTCKVQAYASKSGWGNSEIASKQFVLAKYNVAKVTLTPAPNPKYKGNGSKSLIDFKKGTTTFRDGDWLGFEKQHATAVLDLGKSVEINNVTVSALEASGSWIFFPKGMQVWTSSDGTNYEKVIDKKYPTAKGPTPLRTNNFTETMDPKKARYVKVKVLSNLVNPDWHPNPGGPCWLFIDEILIE